MWRWTCSAHAESGLCGCGGECPFSVAIGIVCGLPVVGHDFLDGAVVGVLAQYTLLALAVTPLQWT